jgi:hypothetical protein
MVPSGGMQSRSNRCKKAKSSEFFYGLATADPHATKQSGITAGLRHLTVGHSFRRYGFVRHVAPCSGWSTMVCRRAAADARTTPMDNCRLKHCEVLHIRRVLGMLG